MSLSKRKLDDFSDDVVHQQMTTATRMRKDHTALPSTSTSTRTRSHAQPEPFTLAPPLQFFVRTLTNHNLVIHARRTDSVQSIHEKIESITRLPAAEQRLIYGGRQLRSDQTLAESGVQRDAVLHLVARMRSTAHPQAWQLINDVVSLIFHLHKNKPVVGPRVKNLKSMVLEFVHMCPQTEPEKAAGHLQTFIESSATSALVMLYVSSHKPNRDAADEAIRQFIAVSRTHLPRQVFHQCVHIVLEFCKLLSWKAGKEDPLYILCRNSLGAIVECIELGDNNNNGKSIGLREVFPFVSELSAKLTHDLSLSTISTSFVGPTLSDVRDFTAFVVPVRIAIKSHVGGYSPIKVPLIDKLFFLKECYADEIALFHRIYLDMLSKMDICLSKVEEHIEKDSGETLFFGWSQYLAILKELYGISTLYSECEESFWNIIKDKKKAFSYLIVRYAKRNEDNKWILNCRDVTDFESRRHLAMMMLPEVRDEYEELHEMLIDRAHLLAESFEYIAQAEPSNLRAGLFMEFKNEEATGPGVLREWFFLVCREIFNPQNALFVACPNDRRRFFPNPASRVDPLHLRYFRFAGRVIALSLMHKIQVGIVLDRVFFLQLGGNPITLEDIKDADPYLYSSCKQILEMDPTAVDQDALGLTFVHEIEELGAMKSIELCPGGKTLVVNSQNRKNYVDSLIQHRFVVAITEQVNNFSLGFSDIMSSREIRRSFFKCLNSEDLDSMLYGSESGISVDDWKKHTEYHGFKETDVQISWFWEILEKMSVDQKNILLFFWTSIKYLPVEGFRGLASQLYIYKTPEPLDRLPSSHTCFYRLCFPAYASKEDMADRLRIITQEHVGCSFGTW